MLPMKHTLTLALLGSLFTAASQAAVLITFEVKAVQTGLTGNSSPGVSISPDGLNVTMGQGQVVLQLMALLNGVDAEPLNEFFSQVNGSWMTVGTSGDLAGFLRGDSSILPGINNLNPFRGAGAKSGVAAELSGTFPANSNDNIGDIGGTSTAASTDYFVARSSSGGFGTVGQSLLLGETILNLTGGTGSTTVRFVPRIGTGASVNKMNIRFSVDNVVYALNGDGTNVGATVDPDAVQYRSVSINAPEPSALSLAAPGLIALTGRRRKQGTMASLPSSPA